MWEWVKRAFDELNNIFQDEFNKILSNSQNMSDSFYHITKSSELNKGPKHTHLSM